VRRAAVLLVCLAVLILLSGALYYGWRERYGGPGETAVVERPPEIAMPQMEYTLSLAPEDFNAALWEQLPVLALPLLPQVTAPPRGGIPVAAVDVRAFHDGSDAYFLLEWKDVSPSRSHGVGEFPDCAAVLFSLEETPPQSSIMMGFQSKANIWHWKADLDAAFWGAERTGESTSPNRYYAMEEQAAFPARTDEVVTACQDVVAAGPGTITPKEKTSVSGRGLWRDARWRVVLKRPLVASDPERDVQFISGKKYIAFAVWDGDKGDRGSRKSISDWVVLTVNPGTSATAAHVPADSRASARIAQREGP
jgi:DMSO reductase family type II enzyme heme b subunit